MQRDVAKSDFVLPFLPPDGWINCVKHSFSARAELLSGDSTVFDFFPDLDFTPANYFCQTAGIIWLTNKAGRARHSVRAVRQTPEEGLIDHVRGGERTARPTHFAPKFVNS